MPQASHLRFISVQHEQNAVHMADGFARATGKVAATLLLADA